MNSSITQRTQPLNQQPISTGPIIYLISRDLRLNDNWALAFAHQLAQQSHQPLWLVFQLLPTMGQRSHEHFDFLLAGLRELQISARNHNISLTIITADNLTELTSTLTSWNPGAIVLDFSPLKGSQQRARHLAKNLNCSVTQVDAHNCIPIWQTSDHQEYAARTIRPKIHRLLPDFLDTAPELPMYPSSNLQSPTKNTIVFPNPTATNWQTIENFVQAPTNHQQLDWQAGETAAHAQLTAFLTERLTKFGLYRNDPNQTACTDLSPYLHFGMISAVTGIKAVLQTTNLELATVLDYDRATPIQPNSPSAALKLHSTATLLEELIVRKELADNFCYHNPNYDSLAGAPNWAQQTLTKHQSDLRSAIYSLDELTQVKTVDLAWNAAQTQLIKTGKLHGYMRMYWAKQLLLWTPDAATAIQQAITLNDSYSLDGGDPNGYVGILWSLAGLHDRPWQQRPIFGTIRTMTASGLARKFDLETYQQHWDSTQ
jgi:deoxyribodipyrimidine photo-lyase